MHTKDYVTLVISVLAFFLSLVVFVQGYRTGRKTSVVEAAQRKNEVLAAYSRVEILQNELRFYSDLLHRKVAAIKIPDGREAAAQTSLKTLRDNTRFLLNLAENSVKEQVDKVRKLSPNEIATQRDARSTLEDLYGKSQELTSKVTGSIAEAKRHVEEAENQAKIIDRLTGNE